MDEKPPDTQFNPIKVYNLINNSTWTHCHCVLEQDGRPILWVNTDKGCFSRPQLNIQTGSEDGPVIAASKAMGLSAGVRVTLGDPEGKTEEEWADVNSSSFSNKEYDLYFGDRELQWRRTHDKELGASHWSQMDFKLVDHSDNDRVLAVYLRDRKLFSHSQVGRIEFFVELGQDLELFCLTAILGIEDSIRRRKNSSAAAGGISGGALAGGY